nr:zinc finger BED domain-containing protein RICESLEEPER 2-like [Quercus suber]
MEDTNIDINKSGSSSPSGSPLKTGRCPLPTMRSLSPFSRSPSPLLPVSSPLGSPSFLCPLNNEEFVTDLQLMFKLVMRNTLKSDIPKIYDNDREKALKITDKNGSRMMLQSRVLRFVYVPSPHTKDVLAEVLVDCFLEWNIDRKLSTITVDNCTINDAMIRLLLNKLDTSSLMLGGFMLHMRCATHILNLIVQDELSLIGDSIKRIRDSVIYWTGSPKRRQKFEENARQLRVQCTKELVIDCKTRWNSTYFMLSTVLIYKDVFLRLAKCETSYTCLPYDHDWEVVKDICGRLELFHSVTVFFFGRKYPTTNMYFALVCELKITLNEWSLSSSEMISTMAKSMLAKFNSYRANVSVVMAIAAILDPRYKKKLLEFYYPNIYGDNSDLEIEKIKNLCYDLLDEYKDVDESPVGNEESSHMLASTSNQVAQIKFRLIWVNVKICEQ